MEKYKGSKRYMLETIGSVQFLYHINTLIEPYNARMDSSDHWMPRGLHDDKEAELKDFLSDHYDASLGGEILKWWLAIPSKSSRTPNWDLVSTCMINGNRGLLLVEAKAHAGELEKSGKPLNKDASMDSLINHKHIENAINEANTSIGKEVDGINISRDKCYQLSNRIAHAWWVANHGIPVVLLYLGYLNAEDMREKYEVFNAHEDWEQCFNEHAKKVGAHHLVDNWVDCGKSSFITVIGSLES